MPTLEQWQVNKSLMSFLVALDISGFSKDPNPDELLIRRMDFFQAIEKTELFPEATGQQTVKVHFLGDEVRLAFQVGVGARRVRNFLRDVLDWLDRTNTKVKGVILVGVVTCRNWHSCDYLNGALPIKAQNWMGRLDAGQVAMDEKFKHFLQTEGIPTSGLREKQFLGEVGYLLAREL